MSSRGEAKSCLVTFVERKIRLLWSVIIPNRTHKSFAITGLRDKQLASHFGHYTNSGLSLDALDAVKLGYYPNYRQAHYHISENIVSGSLFEPYHINANYNVVYYDHNGYDLANSGNNYFMYDDADHNWGHRKNILNPDSVAVGIGTYYDSDNHMFYMTENFSDTARYDNEINSNSAANTHYNNNGTNNQQIDDNGNGNNAGGNGIQAGGNGTQAGNPANNLNNSSDLNNSNNINHLNHNTDNTSNENNNINNYDYSNGNNNKILSTSNGAVIDQGSNNTINAKGSVIVNGYNNTVNSKGIVIANGYNNTVTAKKVIRNDTHLNDINYQKALANGVAINASNMNEQTISK